METDNSPKLFSLAHPLEEVHPVAIRQSNLGLIDNYSLKIVFTSDEPSLAFVYNTLMGHHSVYHIRKLKNDEWVEVTEKLTTSLHSNLSMSSKVSAI